ncbi:hypothetical protein L1987_09528 [Smallanthus sonchifolius]|uniref:Uncharacterized protein n=1 Tax=Smallanthus sonchifolius TaxID=185202 RepID=A0ACB9JPV2_9ASTR|nr:hypothetical protein L1987_09528 [Smallanthus sonchifolius]
MRHSGILVFLYPWFRELLLEFGLKGDFFPNRSSNCLVRSAKDLAISAKPLYNSEFSSSNPFNKITAFLFLVDPSFPANNKGVHTTNDVPNKDRTDSSVEQAHTTTDEIVTTLFITYLNGSSTVDHVEATNTMHTSHTSSLHVKRRRTVNVVTSDKEEDESPVKSQPTKQTFIFS